MTPAQAYAEASQWGSYMFNGDPGAIFYTFHLDDARPNDEAHRRQCLDYTRTLMATSDDPELGKLLEFFTTTPLRTEA